MRSRLHFVLVSLGLAALFACAVKGEYPGSYEPNWTSYAFAETYSTAEGFAVDDPGYELGGPGSGDVDRAIVSTEECLESIEPLSRSERAAAWCEGTSTTRVRQGFRVKVAPDWKHSACSGLEVFPCAVPVESCTRKGLQPTTECPCSCRAIIQDGNMIVTAPDLSLVPWQLTILLSGCDQPQGVERLAKCGALLGPSTSSSGAR